MDENRSQRTLFHDPGRAMRRCEGRYWLQGEAGWLEGEAGGGTMSSLEPQRHEWKNRELVGAQQGYMTLRFHAGCSAADVTATFRRRSGMCGFSPNK